MCPEHSPKQVSLVMVIWKKSDNEDLQSQWAFSSFASCEGGVISEGLPERVRRILDRQSKE